MPDEEESLTEMVRRVRPSLEEFAIRQDPTAADDLQAVLRDHRADLQLVPTGDDAPPSGDPILDRLDAAVDVLERQAGRRRRPPLTAVQGGRDA